MEIMLVLEKDSKQPVYIQIYQYIKEEILAKRFLENEKLPSVRQLSQHLGLSRTTIENAYQQLLAEGYIYSKPQKGYYVSSLDILPVKSEKEFYPYMPENKEEETFEYDFKHEFIEEQNFDFNLWKKHIYHVLQYEQKKLLTYGSVQGEEDLRYQIQKYIHRTRGVVTDPSRIVIGAGVQPLLNLLATLLKKIEISNLGMEDPGFNRAKNIFLENQFSVQPIAVEEGKMDIQSLQNLGLRLCYVSPSHQFPTGSVMKIEQRSKLIKWAKKSNGYIIEDDYNSELRYEGKPIPAMQSLDHDDRVIYLGSFSTILIPSLRISFMVLPLEIIKQFHKYKMNYAQTVSKIEQLALAHMMESKDFEKHIRKIRINYAKKNESVLHIVSQYMSEQVDIINRSSGLQILLKVKASIPEDIIIENAKKEGILLSGLGEYTISQKNVKDTVLMLSFRGISLSKFELGIIKLQRIMYKLIKESEIY